MTSPRHDTTEPERRVEGKDLALGIAPLLPERLRALVGAAPVAGERRPPSAVQSVLRERSAREGSHANAGRQRAAWGDRACSDPHPEEVAHRREATGCEQLRRPIVGRPARRRQLPRSSARQLACPPLTEIEQRGPDPAADRLRMSPGVQTHLLGARLPDAGEADDLVPGQHDPRVGGRIRAVLVELGPSVSRRRTRHALIRQRARVHERRQPIGVMVRCGTQNQLFLHKIPFESALEALSARAHREGHRQHVRHGHLLELDGENLAEGERLAHMPDVRLVLLHQYDLLDVEVRGQDPPRGAPRRRPASRRRPPA
jgi:hypothetical protein